MKYTDINKVYTLHGTDYAKELQVMVINFSMQLFSNHLSVH